MKTYILILWFSINAYGCCSAKALVKEDIRETTEVIETTTESETEIVEDDTETTISEVIIATEDIEDAVTMTKEDTQSETAVMTSVVDHSIWNQLLQKHVSDKGNVNYKGFRADITTFNSYLKLLTENPPQTSWNKDETLAYWMNVYNAFTVKLILDNYPLKSIKDIKGPWNHRFINIGDKWYTLNDVEHRIIRKMNEPRIHFALVCAAVSCPRLYNKAFTAKDLESDFDLLTRDFLNDPSKNELSENHIKLSKIFKWYGGDFKTNGSSLIDFLNQYSGITISSKAKKSYKDYNWNLNE